MMFWLCEGSEVSGSGLFWLRLHACQGSSFGVTGNVQRLPHLEHLGLAKERLGCTF